MYNITQALSFRERVFGDRTSTIYITEFSNVESVSANENYVYDIVMKTDKWFYQYKLPKNNISWKNGVMISVSNACYKFVPEVSFNIPGLRKSRLSVYDFLVRKNVMIIVKSYTGLYYILGKDLGLDMEDGGSFKSGLGGVDFIGSTYKISGREASRVYEIDPSLAESLVNSITWVDPPILLSSEPYSLSEILLTWDEGNLDLTGIEVEMSLDGVNFTKIN